MTDLFVLLVLRVNCGQAPENCNSVELGTLTVPKLFIQETFKLLKFTHIVQNNSTYDTIASCVKGVSLDISHKIRVYVLIDTTEVISKRKKKSKKKKVLSASWGIRILSHLFETNPMKIEPNLHSIEIIGMGFSLDHVIVHICYRTIQDGNQNGEITENPLQSRCQFDLEV